MHDLTLFAGYKIDVLLPLEISQQLSKLMAVFERDTPTPTEEADDTGTGRKRKVVGRRPSLQSPIFPALDEPAAGGTSSSKVHAAGVFGLAACLRRVSA